MSTQFPPPRPDVTPPRVSARKPVWKRWWLWVVAAFVALVAISALAGGGTEPKDQASSSPTTQPSATQPETTPTQAATPSDTQSSEAPANARVERVIDGDTIEVRFRGELIRVRLIGVDTPETVDPSKPVECYGKAASRFTTHRLDGQRVRLAFDVERKDRYGRTLAYVWLGHALLNETLVRQGFATVATFPPDVKYVERFRAAQRAAKSYNRGLWNSCAVGAPPPPPPNVPPGGTGSGSGQCDPSYPGVCIPPYPPDLDCGDVPFTNFEVVGSDPHGFDSDGDGVGCES